MARRTVALITWCSPTLRLMRCLPGGTWEDGGVGEVAAVQLAVRRATEVRICKRRTRQSRTRDGCYNCNKWCDLVPELHQFTHSKGLKLDRHVCATCPLRCLKCATNSEKSGNGCWESVPARNACFCHAGDQCVTIRTNGSRPSCGNGQSGHCHNCGSLGHILFNCEHKCEKCEETIPRFCSCYRQRLAEQWAEIYTKYQHEIDQLIVKKFPAATRPTSQLQGSVDFPRTPISLDEELRNGSGSQPEAAQEGEIPGVGSEPAGCGAGSEKGRTWEVPRGPSYNILPSESLRNVSVSQSDGQVLEGGSAARHQLVTNSESDMATKDGSFATFQTHCSGSSQASAQPACMMAPAHCGTALRGAAPGWSQTASTAWTPSWRPPTLSERLMNESGFQPDGQAFASASKAGCGPASSEEGRTCPYIWPAYIWPRVVPRDPAYIWPSESLRNVRVSHSDENVLQRAGATCFPMRIGCDIPP